jgi:hypothetical protein
LRHPFQVEDKLGAQGIKMAISDKFEQICFLLANNGFVAIFEDMARAFNN